MKPASTPPTPSVMSHFVNSMSICPTANSLWFQLLIRRTGDRSGDQSVVNKPGNNSLLQTVRRQVGRIERFHHRQGRLPLGGWHRWPGAAIAKLLHFAVIATQANLNQRLFPIQREIDQPI